MKLLVALASTFFIIKSSSASLSVMSARRSSKDHNLLPALPASAVATSARPRDECAEVYSAWIKSKDALASEATIEELMASCQHYAETVGYLNTDDLFNSKRGFGKRLRATAKQDSRVTVGASSKKWSIKPLRSQLPPTPRGKTSLETRTVKKLYEDRKHLQVQCVSVLNFLPILPI